MSQPYDFTQDMAVTREGEFLRRVYNWMLTGLAVTGGVAWFVSGSETLVRYILGTPLFYVLIFGELGLVWYLAARVHKMSASSASILFMVYSVLNGLTLSVIFLAYTGSDIARAFFVAAAMFGAMSVYGYTTKKSLASWGSFLFMGLIGIIIASLVNLFVHSTMIHWIVSFAGVLIFTGLTAYDTQQLKQMAAGGFDGEEMAGRYAILGALKLYLDFINLFLMLLRIFGGGRN